MTKLIVIHHILTTVQDSSQQTMFASLGYFSYFSIDLISRSVAQINTTYNSSLFYIVLILNISTKLPSSFKFMEEIHIWNWSKTNILDYSKKNVSTIYLDAFNIVMESLKAFPYKPFKIFTYNFSESFTMDQSRLVKPRKCLISCSLCDSDMNCSQQNIDKLGSTNIFL